MQSGTFKIKPMEQKRAKENRKVDHPKPLRGRPKPEFKKRSNIGVELLDDMNVDVPSWKYPRNLESPRVSSPGFGNDSKMMVITDLHVQSVTMAGHIYRDVILEQHVRWFRGAMGAEFHFMDDNARPHHANIVD
ncbi:DDE_3 domain-containing protein [Trichonephila clavipes]|uniref:DDE_3 domain-containing protein n=1 Tax=Trichonephila clavipes TaxID=2585209 RepID=A0A8X6SAN4_TRICX|nr:DDE_3 domain-containing protein [Trichonephila clavipes]